MTPSVSLHPWSQEALLSKALLYADRMESYAVDDEQFALWSALSLEVLARAALASISPVLLADGGNWRNLAYAIGCPATAKKFVPNSIPTREVFARLNELLDTFTEEVAGFCAKHLDRRNSELHTGELSFSSLGTSEWLPRFYEACSILLATMNKELADFISHSTAAEAMITSLKDATAKAVIRDIKVHAQVWANKTEEEREQANLQATASAMRNVGHRVTCPACNCPAIVQGNPTGTVATQVQEDEVIQRQTMLPSSFACVACGLRISGLSRLCASGLGDAFTAKTKYSAADFFGLYTEDELEQARKEGQTEEDFNEY